MDIYKKASDKFGTVIFDGQEYALTNDADYTGRLLPGGFINYIEAKDGEAYDFEMSARSIDKDGNEYTAYWIFSGRKGEEDPELDSYDYSEANRVVAREQRK